jgi:hypothetical protein
MKTAAEKFNSRKQCRREIENQNIRTGLEFLVLVG